MRRGPREHGGVAASELAGLSWPAPISVVSSLRLCSSQSDGGGSVTGKIRAEPTAEGREPADARVALGRGLCIITATVTASLRTTV